MKQLLGWLAGGVAAAGVVGVVVLATQDGDPPVPLAAMDQPLAVNGNEAGNGAAADTISPTPDDADAVTLPLPMLSDLRIEPDGMAVLAGSAVAGEVLAILLDGQEATRVTVGADGQFAVVMFMGRSDQLRILSLRADPDGTPRDATETVLIAPTDGPVTPEAVTPETTTPETVTPETALVAAATPVNVGDAPLNPTDAPKDADAAQADDVLAEGAGSVQADTASAEDTPQALALAVTDAVAGALAQDGVAVSDEDAQPDITATDAPATDAPATDTTVPDATLALAATALDAAPAAPAVAPVLVTDETGVRLAQPAIAAGATPEVLSSVALDMIRYDASGQVVLSGRAKGSAVRVYLDNRQTADARIGEGAWEAVLGDVAPGVYTIRIDELDAGGDVSSRIETPFLREAPEAVALAMAEGASATSGVAMKTVQPGHTLWAIARERYGEGMQYVEVFAANRDRIRNPDLIYPGQVFVLPETVAD